MMTTMLHAIETSEGVCVCVRLSLSLSLSLSVSVCLPLSLSLLSRSLSLGEQRAGVPAVLCGVFPQY